MDQATQKVLIYGAGGHGKVVADILESAGATVLGFIDDKTEHHGQPFSGYSILGGRNELANMRGDKTVRVVVAICDNGIRRQIVDALQAEGHMFAHAIHPSAILAKSSSLGAGSMVSARAVVNPSATIGEHTVINTGAIVEHDNTIGSFVHIAPGVKLGGHVTVGSGSSIFTNATVLPRVVIGKNCVVGAGAVVLKDVPDGATVVGNPAKIIYKS